MEFRSTVPAAVLAGLLVVAGCSPPAPTQRPAFIRSVPWATSGMWLKADTHVHTKFSDGGAKLAEVVEQARGFGVDVLAITDHADAELAATSDEYFEALDSARARHPGLVLLAGLEWNVPPWQGREHATVLFPPGKQERVVLRNFQTLFDDWKRPARDPDLAARALLWLEDQAIEGDPLPVAIYNHPSRRRSQSTELVSELEHWHRTSPLAIGFEGGPGHQESEPIGAYDEKLKTVDRWDPAAADVGGAWDQLLQRGLPIWGAVATSDFHDNAPARQDDFWPGQFSETWLYAPEKSPAGALAALQAGTFFGVHGQIVRNVQFQVAAEGLPRPAIAGEAIRVPGESEVLVTLEMEIPKEDWQGLSNNIDEVEVIIITPQEAKVAARQTPSGGHALRLPVRVPAGGVTVRARGRRLVGNRPALMFYTNPIQILTDDLPPERLPSAGTHSPELASSDSAGTARRLPGWLVWAFVMAGGLLVSLVDRWQIEARRRFFSNKEAPTRKSTSVPRSWQRYFVAILLGFVFLAVYGSFVPLRLAAMDWATATQRFIQTLSQSLDFSSRTDWATNVLLFVPVGFFATGLLFGAQPSDRRRGIGLVVVVAACGLLSLAIEFGQLWVKERTCSQNDMVAETLGGLLGAAGWLIFGPVLLSWLQRIREASRPRERVEHFLELYLAVVGVSLLMPLDLTLRPAELVDKLQEGKINLVPFADLVQGGQGLLDLLGDLLLLLPVGVLVAIWRWPQRETVRPLSSSLGMGFLIVAAIEGAQLLVYSRYSSTTDLLTGLCGIGAGWWLASQVTGGSTATLERKAGGSLSSALIVGSALYAVAVAAVLCLPFERLANEAEASERLIGLFSRPPLAAFYSGTELNAVSEMLRKTLLFIPLGGLGVLALLRLPIRSTSAWPLVGCWLAGLALAGGIELAQVWLLPHIADVTDVLFCTLGLTIGMVVTRRVLAGESPAPLQPATR